MTYIDYLNAFDRWLEEHNLSASAQLLYYRLLSLSNRCMWPEWISVDNLRLMSMIRVSDKRMLWKARDELVRAGFIAYKAGTKGNPTKYTIRKGCDSCTESRIESCIESCTESGIENAPHNKNNTKTKTLDTPPLSPGGSARETYGMDDEGFALFWQAYPKKQGKINARKAWDKLVPLAKQDILLRQHILDSLERWNRSDEWSRDDGRYIPLPASWLNGRRWEDEVMVKKTVKEQIDELYNHPDEYWTAGGVVPDCEDPWN